jgi:hypothetical protein
MKMLSVYTKSGFHLLRTQYLDGWEFEARKGYYESMGYTVKEIV